MKMNPLPLSLVLLTITATATACATTTPAEKIESGITREAFGAPLVISGGASLVLDGLDGVIVATSGSRAALPLVLVGALAAASVFGGGLALVLTGNTLVDEGLADLSRARQAELDAEPAARRREPVTSHRVNASEEERRLREKLSKSHVQPTGGDGDDDNEPTDGGPR